MIMEMYLIQNYVIEILSEHWYKYDNQNRMIYEKENAVSIGSSKGSSYFEYYKEYYMKISEKYLSS